MRVLFIPVADRPECATALNTAFALGHTVGKRICIAWNQSVEAAQAVAAAMPLTYSSRSCFNCYLRI